MNRLTIIGNLTGDPVLNSVGEKTVCNFSVAVNRRKKIEGQPEADFFRVAVWGRTAENCQKFLAKGRRVAVVGQVSVRTYQANDGTTRASMEVFAEDVEFLNSPNSSVQNEAPQEQAAPAGVFTAVETDELPFE